MVQAYMEIDTPFLPFPSPLKNPGNIAQKLASNTAYSVCRLFN